jgi:hypothetical protein
MDCGKTTGPVPAKRSTIVLGSLALVSILALVATMLIPTWLFAQEATGAEVSAISELPSFPGTRPLYGRPCSRCRKRR